ncbi:MAG: hypothetical protein AABZ30_13255, partial [Myxococcota bacterium]
MGALRRFAPLLALGAAALAVYWPVLAGQSYALRDFLMWSIGSRAVTRDALLEGHLALWNPYIGLGMPHVANPLNGVFYPFHLLLALAPTVTAVNLLFLVHVAATGAGGYALGRVLGAGRAGALGAALTTMLCGVTSSGWASGIGVVTSAWLPWCAAAAVRLGGAPAGLGGRRVVALAVPLALSGLAGDPFALIRASALALPLTLGGAPRGRRRWAVVSCVGACALGVVLASAALAPAFALLGQSERQGGLSLAASELWSLHPVRLLETIAPGLLGDATDPMTFVGERWAGAPNRGPIGWAYSVYLGFGVVALAPLALGGPGKAKAPALRLSLIVAALVGVLLALGRHTPIHGLARTLVPPLAYFRYPEKYMDIVAVALAGLVALGIDRALAAPRRAWRASVWAGAGYLGAAAIARAADAPETFAVALCHGAAACAACALALVWARRRPVAGAVALSAVVALDLALAALPQLRWVPARSLEEAVLPIARGQ